MTRSPEQQAVFDTLSCGLGRRDEVPNKELGQRIAADRDGESVAVLVQLLSDPESDSSAIKALYECGYLAPDLLVPHVDAFLALLDHRKNRLVWGGMIAIACVADAEPGAVWHRRKPVMTTFETGSTITKDASIIALSRVAGSSPQRATALAPWFVDALCGCRPKDVAPWAEKVLPPMGPTWRTKLCLVLQSRIDEAPTKAARERIERLLARYNS